MSDYKTMPTIDIDQMINSDERIAAIKIAQSVLASNGYYTSRVDGKFGPKTEDAVRHWQMTHTGPKGKPLDVDGIIGTDTWFSLLNPSKPTPVPVLPEIPKVANDLTPRQQLVNAAFGEYRQNVHEIPDGSNWGGRICLYLAGLSPCAWCAFFVMWLHKTCFGGYPYDKRKGLVKDIWNDAKKNGHAFTIEDGYNPIPGDEMVLLYRNSSGKLTGTGHLGLVVAAHWKSKKFQTIEGNSGNRVKFLTSNYSRPALVGFINRFGDNGKADFKQGLLETADVDDGRTR